MPGGRHSAVAHSGPLADSHSACDSSIVRGAIGSVHEYSETVELEHRGRLGRAFQVIDERLWPGARVLDDREGVQDRLVALGRKPRQDLHPVADRRVGGVDNRRRAFAALDEDQCGTCVVGTYDASGEWRPPAEVFETLLRVATDRHHIGFTGAQLSGEGATDIEAYGHGERKAMAFRNYEHEVIAEQIDARLRADLAAGVQIVHPGESCRGKQVGG